jgi:L-cystine uptake protein TcyP (sodium:dicarboxylate symporter family)
MVAELAGVSVSLSFLLVLILVTLELSIASPGTTSAWTIMFSTLSLPVSYVGLFTVYRMFTANYGTACTEAYDMLEELEAAYKLDGIKTTDICGNTDQSLS